MVGSGSGLLEAADGDISCRFMVHDSGDVGDPFLFGMVIYIYIDHQQIWRMVWGFPTCGRHMTLLKRPAFHALLPSASDSLSPRLLGNEYILMFLFSQMVKCQCNEDSGFVFVDS